MGSNSRMRKRPRIRKCEAVSVGGQARAPAAFGALMIRSNRSSSNREAVAQDSESPAPGLRSALAPEQTIPASAPCGSLEPPERSGAAPSETRRRASARARKAAAWRRPDVAAQAAERRASAPVPETQRQAL